MTSSNRIHLAMCVLSNIIFVCVMCTCRCQKVGNQCSYMATFSSSKFLDLQTLIPCIFIALRSGTCSRLRSRIERRSRLRGIANYYKRDRFDSSVHFQSLLIMNFSFISIVFSGSVNDVTGSKDVTVLSFALYIPLNIDSCSFLPSNTSYNHALFLAGIDIT